MVPLSNEQRATVEANMRLVGKFVSQKYRHDWRHDDLVSAGYLGLIHAVQKYDGSMGVFSSYAYNWIFAYVQQEKRRLMFYRVPSNHYTSPRSTAIEEDIREAGQLAIQAQQVTWGDADVTAVLAVEHDRPIADYEPLYREVDALPSKHQAVILACAQNGCTERAVAGKLGISQARVRQIKDSALSTLRRRLSRLERLGAI